MPSGPESGKTSKLHPWRLRGAERIGRRFRQLHCAFILAFAALQAAGLATPSPTLHTVQEVRTLTPSDAARGYPVHLERAQITWVQACPGIVFLMDATGGI